MRQTNIKLLDAAGYGNLEDFNQALADGADIRSTTPWGCTALHRAAANNRMNIITAIIATEDGKEMISLLDKLKKTPLDLAKNEEIKNILIEHGAKTFAQIESERQDAERQEAEYRQTWQGYIHRGAQDILNSICAHPYLTGAAALGLATAFIYAKPDTAKTIIGDKIVDAMLSGMEKVVGLVR